MNTSLPVWKMEGYRRIVLQRGSVANQQMRSVWAKEIPIGSDGTAWFTPQAAKNITTASKQKTLACVRANGKIAVASLLAAGRETRKMVIFEPAEVRCLADTGTLTLESKLEVSGKAAESVTDLVSEFMLFLARNKLCLLPEHKRLMLAIILGCTPQDSGKVSQEDLTALLKSDQEPIIDAGAIRTYLDYRINEYDLFNKVRAGFLSRDKVNEQEFTAIRKAALELKEMFMPLELEMRAIYAARKAY